MALETHPVQPQEQDALASFLASAFGVPPAAPFLESRLLWWKYFQPRTDWPAPRSWVMKDGSQIVAHAGIWPLRFVVSGQKVDSMHIIDWAASPQAPGSGVLLYREVMRQAPTLFGVGGSDAARKVVRKLGFSEPGRLKTYVQVVRPWRQLRERPARHWKNSAKFVRNAVWSLRSRRAASGCWSAAPVDSFPESYAPVWEARDRSLAYCDRSPVFLNYVLACPVQTSGFLLYRDRILAGHLVLCRLQGQVRIADLSISSSDPADWARAYGVAVDLAAADPLCCEVVAVSSATRTQQALLENGFRYYLDQPIWLHDPCGLMAGSPPLSIQPLDSDSFFLSDPDQPFLT